MRSDGSVVVGFDWSRGNHPLGKPAVIYACFIPLGPKLVVTSDGKHVTVTPSRSTIPPTSKGVVPIHVVAHSPGVAHLQLKILNRYGRLSASAAGPRVVADSTTWHFSS
jgi:hypothetical protein